MEKFLFREKVQQGQIPLLNSDQNMCRWAYPFPGVAISVHMYTPGVVLRHSKRTTKKPYCTFTTEYLRKVSQVCLKALSPGDNLLCIQELPLFILPQPDFSTGQALKKDCSLAFQK